MTVQKQRPIAPPHGSACGSPADVLRRTSFKDPSVFALRRFDLSPSSSGTPSDGYSFAPRLYPNLSFATIFTKKLSYSAKKL